MVTNDDQLLTNNDQLLTNDDQHASASIGLPHHPLQPLLSSQLLITHILQQSQGINYRNNQSTIIS